MNQLKAKKETKGELYSKLKSMYEMSLPGSLASYASQTYSGKYYRSYFDTKVEQRDYFECLCGKSLLHLQAKSQIKGYLSHETFCRRDGGGGRAGGGEGAVQQVRDRAALRVREVRHHRPVQGGVQLPALLGHSGR